jgi:hypothetical protein
VVQVSGAGAEAVTHCATFTPAESLVAEQASRAFGMMEACEWADLDALAQQVGPTVVARGVCVSWAGRVCQLGGACVSAGRGMPVRSHVGACVWVARACARCVGSCARTAAQPRRWLKTVGRLGCRVCRHRHGGRCISARATGCEACR